MASASTGAPAYRAEQYAADSGALPIAKTVHVEAMADDGAAEASCARTLPHFPHPPHTLRTLQALRTLRTLRALRTPSAHSHTLRTLRNLRTLRTL